MDHHAEITKFISKQQFGIEIAPWHVPLAPKKQGYNCLVLDVFDTETLRSRACADPHIGEEVSTNIEEVDLLGSAANIAEIVSKHYTLGTFDYIISSHNFEHLPDILSFLQGCEKVLKENGKLSMAIPDKRACFDYFRPHTALSSILEAHFEKRNRPSQKQIFEQNSLIALYCIDGKENFAFYLGVEPSKVLALKTLREEFQKWQNFKEKPDDLYLDAHCWTFTPSSFALIMLELRYLGLTSLEIIETNGPNGCEFYVHLQKTSSDAEISDEAFYERRQVLLHQINEEISQTSSYFYKTNLAAKELTYKKKPNLLRSILVRTKALIRSILGRRITALIRSILGWRTKALKRESL